VTGSGEAGTGRDESQPDQGPVRAPEDTKPAGFALLLSLAMAQFMVVLAPRIVRSIRV